MTLLFIILAWMFIGFLAFLLAMRACKSYDWSYAEITALTLIGPCAFIFLLFSLLEGKYGDNWFFRDRNFERTKK